ncbi:PAXBP1 [Cordylochernes scorpioides]|uniref:PAXBP1 n=1 Tax=Cordylochernes scorpioides TaxID=51811 RepID=A0ABY6JZ35_9ARAC|nr:PAXBP1 [Cordylochernes scorpioides]
MSLFKKPNRKFRQRVNRSDSEEDESADIKTASQLKKQPKSPSHKNSNESNKESNDKTSKTSSSLLSFQDEFEDSEMFKIKKSNYSKRMTKQVEKERKKKQKQEAKAAEVPAQVEKKKDPASKVWNILNGEEAEDLESDEDLEEGRHRFRKTLKSGEIPDAETIYAMKKQRQRARELGDYIPLEDNQDEPENQSRLVREDDNDRSDDEENDRINFSVDMDALDKKKAREAILNVNEERELEKEEAAELDRWEEEQIRKGVSVTQFPQTIAQGQLLFNCPVDVDERQNFIPPIIKVREAITTDMIAERLRENLTLIKDRHRAHQNELDKCHNDLLDSSTTIVDLEKKLPELEKSFKVYQQLRGYVADLVECLDLKVKLIDSLEQQTHDLLKQRAINLALRRQQDTKDQSDDMMTATARFSRGTNFDSPQAQNEEKARRSAEREGRRMRRRKKRERHLILGHNEGMSTDDEEQENEILKFNTKKDSILEQAQEVFSDVVDEFSTIQGITAEFNKWRNLAPTSYYEAYAPLCLAKIFTPFIQLELLTWNPISGSSDIESMSWFQNLVAYGYLEDYDNEESDTSLIPNIIEKVVLKKMTALVPYMWDPLSTAETLQLVDLTKKLFEIYPTITGNSKPVQNFLHAVVNRLSRAIEQDVFIPLYPKEVLLNRMIGAAAFFNRQFWSTTKLFRNILLWNGVIGDKLLKELTLDSLLNRYLLITLRNSIFLKDCLEKCQAIVTALPSAWFTSLPGCTTLPPLQNFATFLKDLALHIAADATVDEVQTKSSLKVIIQQLYTIGALDEVAYLTKEFSAILAYK